MRFRTVLTLIAITVHIVLVAALITTVRIAVAAALRSAGAVCIATLGALALALALWLGHKKRGERDENASSEAHFLTTYPQTSYDV